MAYRPSQRKHNTRVVTLKTNDGGRFNVTYRPGAISPQMSREVQHLAESDSEIIGMYEMAAAIIADWELEDDNGQPIPVTAEAMESNDIDTPLLNWIMERVIEDAKPGETKLGSLRRG
jgi:hypothetical protein